LKEVRDSSFIKATGRVLSGGNPVESARIRHREEEDSCLQRGKCGTSMGEKKKGAQRKRRIEL